MADDNHRIIIDRASRMLRQSKILRQMSNELPPRDVVVWTKANGAASFTRAIFPVKG
jgi:hypothetical protein